MKRFKSIVVMAIAVLATTTAYILPASPAMAATTNTSSSSLSLTPKKNYVIEPGKSVSDKLTIHNLDSTAELTLSLRVIDFSYTDDTGTPKLFLAQNSPQTTWSLKPYLTVPESVTIPAGGTKTLNMQVSIPKNRGAGSLYSAILYSSGSGGDSSESNVGLSASGVTLVFVNIPGTVSENMDIKKLGPYDSTKKTYSWFNPTAPEQMGYLIKNSGNVTEAPVGSIVLKSMWGPEVKINNINPSQSLALIGQSRTFSVCIKSAQPKADAGASDSEQAAVTCEKPSLLPGLYTSTLDLFYGQNGNPTQEAMKVTRFLYLPWWFIVVMLVVIGALIFFGRKLYRKIRLALYGPQGGSRSRRATHRR